jgi:hypothetical protein
MTVISATFKNMFYPNIVRCLQVPRQHMCKRESLARPAVNTTQLCAAVS